MIIYSIAFYLVFIFHELEEFIMIKKFKKTSILKDSDIISKKMSEIDVFSFRATVIEEIVLISVFLIMFIAKSNYGLIIDIFVVYMIHIAIHLVQTLYARRYLPFTITSIISFIFATIFVRYLIINNLTELFSPKISLIILVIIYLNLVLVLNLFKYLKKI